MSRIVYVNGAFEPEEVAKISVFDRGFLFGDAVYEVTAVLDGKLVDFDGHLARLDRSLGESFIWKSAVGLLSATSPIPPRRLRRSWPSRRPVRL